jgi:flagellar hook-associated protein 3 FlgL
LIGTALTKVDSVFNDINDMVGILGADRQMMADKLVEHEDFSLMLQSQIADIEDVDQAEAISRFQMLQTQLQTSFQLTSILRQMTLADFI